MDKNTYVSTSRQAGFIHHRLVSLIVWLNILIQVLFPLAGAFAPVIARAADNGPQVTQPASSMAPLPEVTWDDKAPAGDEQASRMAGYASQVGGALGQHGSSDAAASLARSMATGAAGGAVQDWLSQFGTARVQLDADRSFSLKNSQFDMLVPLWEQPDMLAFTQTGLHRADDRTQGNLGFGLRWFAADYMLGANTFFDYDFSRYHYRAGVGAEYWRDYLKLSANGYLRLSDWRDSPDVTDYEARPANGWDIRTEGYLPAWPHLGATLKYEQYYGNEVALFGTENRQRDPHAITAGLTYTPVPLLTLSAEQRQGQSGRHDTRIGAEVTVQPGVAWSKQTDPDAVAALRSLAGSRHDLVDRNSDIVLEYRKKEVIRLKMASLVTGTGGEQKSLGVSVNSKYGYAGMAWSAAEFEAAGGQLVADTTGPGWSVILPAYQQGLEAINTYTLSAVASDARGNHSAPAATQITVLSPQTQTTAPPWPTTSSIRTDKTAYPAGSTLQVTVTLNDPGGSAIIGKAALLTETTVNVPGGETVPDSRWQDNKDGTYTNLYTVTATGAGLQASLQIPGWNTSVLSGKYALTGNLPAQASSSIEMDNQAYLIGNDMTVTVMLKDTEGSPLPGMAALLRSDKVKVPSGTAKADNWTDNGDGTYSRVFTANTENTGLKAILMMTGWKEEVSSAAYDIVAAPVATSSTISTDKDRYSAGQDMTVTVTLRSQKGNPVVGQTALLTDTVVMVPHAMRKTGWSDNGNGIYSAVYTASTAGSGLKSSLQMVDWRMPVESGAYVLSAPLPAQVSSAIVLNTDEHTTYTVGEEMTVKVVLNDAQYNPLPGQADLLTDTAVTVPNTLPKTRWTDNGNGTYTRVYTASTVGAGLKARLQMADWSTPLETKTYDVINAFPAQDGSTISIDKSLYVIDNDVTVTVTLKDAAGNTLPGQASLLTDSAVRVPNVYRKTDWSDNGDGTYTRIFSASSHAVDTKATLTLPGWSGENTSSPYSILTAPVPDGSTISTDKTSYIAGEDMTLIITLKDQFGTGVPGEIALLEERRIKVMSAMLKTAWVDNGDGTYTAVYTATRAASGSKAFVRLAGWNDSVSSGEYLISAAAPAHDSSSITLDKNSYTAADDMTLTVTLKDAWNNPITGQASLLTDDAVLVPNTQPKTSWSDSGNGTYTRVYTAKTAGAELKATLQMTDWSAPLETGAFAITAGIPVQENSAISTDKTSYIVGEDMTVDITLRDADGNGTPGQAALFDQYTLHVQSAEPKTAWVDKGDGTYTAVYTARWATMGAKAVLRLVDWKADVKSDGYSIDAAAPAHDTSSIIVDNTRYNAADDMKVTIVLRDAWNNAIINGTSLLTDDVVTVPHTQPKSDWQNNGNGSYTRIYIANAVGADLKATFKMPDWDSATESVTYSVTTTIPAEQGSAIMVDKNEYVVGQAITVTVTLKDAAGSAMSGLGFLLNNSVVVPLSVDREKDWTDHNDGTYTKILTAQSEQSALKATLKVNGWSGDVSSGTYNILEAPVRDNSTISTDKTHYAAGEDINVDVFLAGWNGGLPGRLFLLNEQTVSVEGGTMKTAWTDEGNGHYSAVYATSKASKDEQHAWLSLPRYFNKPSEGYFINASDPAETGSSISIDKNSYNAGEGMTVIVTLRDAFDNPIDDRVSLLTSENVKVSGARIDTRTEWVDNKDGTYTTQIIAAEAGTGQTASIHFPAWRAEVKSTAYDIIAGAPSEHASDISSDNTRYTAGENMAVIVTLRDDWGNAVPGQAGLLTDTVVTVPGAEATADNGWSDKGDGTYSRIYAAKSIGTGLTASVKLNEWNEGIQSAPYEIISTVPVQGNSTIALQEDYYFTGESMAVTVTLKDLFGNAVAGEVARLTDAAVTVPNAVIKSDWHDNNDGTYTATYRAQSAGTGLTASLRLAEWSSGSSSQAYSIMVAVAPKEIVVNGYSYAPGQGFPTTGFADGSFTIVPTFGSASDYIWTVDADWVKVSNGEVKLSGGDYGSAGQKVTVTARLKDHNSGLGVQYSFTIKEWFNVISKTMSVYDARHFCSGSGRLPTTQELTGSADHGSVVRGTLGGLISEWGELTHYHDFSGQRTLWTDDYIPDYMYWVVGTDGSVSSMKGDSLLNAYCIQN